MLGGIKEPRFGWRPKRDESNSEFNPSLRCRNSCGSTGAGGDLPPELCTDDQAPRPSGNRSHHRCGRGLLRVGAVGAAALTHVHRSGVFMHPSGMCSSRHADEEWPCKRRRRGVFIFGQCGRFYILNVVILRCARALAVFCCPLQSVRVEFGPTVEECSWQYSTLPNLLISLFHFHNSKATVAFPSSPVDFDVYLR